jgi:hypothetical protein
MALTTLGLTEDLLSALFRADDLRILLSRHDWAVPVLTSVPGAVSDPAKVVHQVAEALLKSGLVPDPLVPTLHAELPYQKEKIDAFLCAFLVRETADQLARLGPHRLYDWTLDAAPGPIARRLQGKTKDAATIAEQLPALLQRERGATLRSLASLWPPHTVEAARLDQLIRQWAMVAEPALPTPPPPPDDEEEEDEDDDTQALPNDLHHFIITLDRAVVWGKLIERCAEPSHQLLVVRGEPTQGLHLFRARVLRYLSNPKRVHRVHSFGPGNDHQPATTAAAWEALLRTCLGLAHLPTKKAIREATRHQPALCMVGLNAPLHLGPDSLRQDDLDALCEFLQTLPERLPALDPTTPRPLRLLLTVQVAPGLGRRDPVYQALNKAINEAKLTADERAKEKPGAPLQVALIGTLETPTFAEVEGPINTRAQERHGRTPTEEELDVIEAAYDRAKDAGLPFVALAEALWFALPAWMRDAP